MKHCPGTLLINFFVLKHCSKTFLWNTVHKYDVILTLAIVRGWVTYFYTRWVTSYFLSGFTFISVLNP